MKCLINQIKTADKHHVGKKRTSEMEDKVKEILHSDIMYVTERGEGGRDAHTGECIRNFGSLMTLQNSDFY